ncbi:DUF443 family protein [Terribacillus saccharophilus]|uniref:Tandem five-transmembrane protein n=1 Tax=Terribacillus saccharophilus TaxID=361277 RepID=A0ABX4GUQ7_9BACI|nr:hypothetical protein CHH56_15365 [Terribacillus saccharophilus]PAD94857.1 hypothetical protein CHH50_16455 [Terribacillus saccharophilus]PAD98606.1 hypothetical protein CHH48_16465 [Terribacillus saccharophilus]
MNSESITILKNFRYSLIRIEDQYYIVDRDKPFLLIFFLPFIYWFLPKRAFLISEQSANLLQTVPNKDSNKPIGTLLIAGISLFLANLIEPFLDYLNINITQIAALSVTLLILIIITTIRYIISNKNKQSLFKRLDLDDDAYYTFWIWPKSFKNSLYLLCLFLFFGAFAAVFMLTFISTGNTFLLFAYTLCLLFLVFSNILIIPPGKNTIKFRIK